METEQSKLCVLRCNGGTEQVDQLFNYFGPEDCRISVILHQGNRQCIYGCLGGGHCVSVCPSNAIRIGPNRLPLIDPAKCTGCGTCLRECPRQVLELIPRAQLIFVACKSLDSGELVAKACKVGCDSCALCIEVCPTPNAISMDANLPLINYAACTSCGICHRKCPAHSFTDRAKARPYAIISLQCDGCAACMEVCQFEAIDGAKGSRHIVKKDKCMGCGQCFHACPIKVITMMGALGYAESA